MRTALTLDARKIDRKALGPVGGAAIKLSDDADVSMGLTVSEGLETTLA
jgi:putative DNA primase/helicase